MAAYCPTPAKLTLAIPGGPTLDLMDDQQGFRVSELDLGYPTVREDSDPWPARNGENDLTRLVGARAVSISGALVPSAAGSRQKAWHALAPFLDPRARVTVTYQVDGDVGARTMTVRAAQLSGPFNDRSVSMVHLGFKAADPFAYDATGAQAIVYVTTSGSGGGRAYNLVFNRVYPPGGQTSATLINHGDFPAYPLLRFYGPITGPSATFGRVVAGVTTTSTLAFQPSYIISPGHFVEVDTAKRSALLDGDPAQSQYPYLMPDMGSSGWPSIPPDPGYATVVLNGTGTSSATQLVVSWADPFLL
jgi:hypothetical protein